MLRGRFGRLTGALIIGIMVLLLAACGSPARPSLSPPGAAEPVGVISGTPTPEDYMTGRWFMIIGEVQSQEREGISVMTLQLRLSTPERLLPGYFPDGLESLEVEGAQSIVAVRVGIENNTNRDFDFDPTGAETVLNVNGESARPSKPLSSASARIPRGASESFMITFPLKESALEEIHDLTYSVRGHDFFFTDLVLSTPPS